MDERAASADMWTASKAMDQDKPVENTTICNSALEQQDGAPLAGRSLSLPSKRRLDELSMLKQHVDDLEKDRRAGVNATNEDCKGTASADRRGTR